MRGDRETVSDLIRHGFDVNATRRNGDSALLAAAARGRLEVVEFLVQKVSETDLCYQRPRDMASALILAARGGHREVCEALLRTGEVKPVTDVIQQLELCDNQSMSAKETAVMYDMGDLVVKIEAAQSQVKRRVVICRFNCGIKGLELRKVKTHEKVCPKRLVTCPNGCGQGGITRKIQSIHEQYQCPKRHRSVYPGVASGIGAYSCSDGYVFRGDDPLMVGGDLSNGQSLQTTTKVSEDWERKSFMDL
jgi:hypothetical protein